MRRDDCWVRLRVQGRGAVTRYEDAKGPPPAPINLVLSGCGDAGGTTDVTCKKDDCAVLATMMIAMPNCFERSWWNVWRRVGS